MQYELLLLVSVQDCGAGESLRKLGTGVVTGSSCQRKLQP